MTGPPLTRLDPEAVAPGRPNPWAGALLCVAGALMGVAFFLPWHLLRLGDSDVVVGGLRASPFLVPVVVALAFYGVRLLVRFAGGPSKAAVIFLTLVALTIVASEYVDIRSRAAAMGVDPYYGPGYLLALAGVLLAIAASVVGMLVRE